MIKLDLKQKGLDIIIEDIEEQIKKTRDPFLEKIYFNLVNIRDDMIENKGKTGYLLNKKEVKEDVIVKGGFKGCGVC